MYVINVSASGEFRAILGAEDVVCIFSVFDPLLTDPVFTPLRDFVEVIASEGITSVHMESDNFRAFTHTVQGGSVRHEEGTDSPLFGYVQSNREAIIAALTSAQEPTYEPDQVPSP